MERILLHGLYRIAAGSRVPGPDPNPAHRCGGLATIPRASKRQVPNREQRSENRGHRSAPWGETGRTSNWDDHSVNADIFKAYREKLPSFDQSVSALIEDLYQRGLDRHVLFIFCGEFGRTPRIAYQDPSGRPGRDHWPRAMSVLLAGGLKMGQVVGATNPRGEEPSRRAMNSNCLLATLYRRFGIDVHHLFHDSTGRPIAVLPHGEPIAELFWAQPNLHSCHCAANFPPG
jgi:hypothetical protein